VAQFLVDEDLPRSLARDLRDIGLAAEDVRDVGLRGTPDSEIWKHVVSNGLTLISGDLGFGNELKFPRRGQQGLVLVRFPTEVPAQAIKSAIVRALDHLTEAELSGAIIIVEPGRLRRRGPASS
jgi:predicted nuclease of predicted toxin-antitoxin system